jgi:XRE family transcriptional regulator, regulator of sulfur utilization
VSRSRTLALAAIAWAFSTSGAPAAPAALPPKAFTWEEILARPLGSSGLSRQVLRDPTATLDQLEFHITTLPPGRTSHAPHRHPNEEIIIIKEGTVEALVEGVERRLGPGSFIFQASNHLHGIKNVGDTPATYYVINWHAPGMLAKPPAQ